MGPAGFSSDGKKLLITQYISARDSRIHIVDLQSGDQKILEGGLDNVSVNLAQSFDAKDEGFYFKTNQKSEFNQLAYRRFDEKEITIISSKMPWDLDYFTISEDKSRIAFTTNEEGMTKAFLLDPKSHNYAPIKNLPIGLLGGMEFSPDNSKLGLTLNTPQSSSDTFSLALQSDPLQHGDLTRWTQSEVGGLDTTQFFTPELIRYQTFDNRKIPAFIYKPDGKGPFPVVVSIHGGPESQFQPAFASTYQLWMDKLGVAVIAPNVRGSSGYGKEYLDLDNGYKREDSVKDIGALLDWIATQPDLDSSRVAVYGGSYGGYMTLASAVHYSDRLKAAVDIVGISNFVTFLENTEAYRQDLRRAEYGDERDPDMRAFLEKISPNNHIDRIDVPLFVIQGQNDPRVPVTEAEQIVKSLREANKPVWYMNALNEGHGYSKKENRDIYTQAVVLFFKEHLIN